MELLQVGKHLWAYAKRCLEIWRTFWCMPASASRPNVNINNATSDWLTATAWPHLIGWCKKIRKADWLMMTSDAVENEWKYPICPAKNPALSGYKIKFLYIFIWVNMLRHRFAAAFGGSFAHGSAMIDSVVKTGVALLSFLIIWRHMIILQKQTNNRFWRRKKSKQCPFFVIFMRPLTAGCF